MNKKNYQKEKNVAVQALQQVGEKIEFNKSKIWSEKHGFELKAEIDKICDDTIKKTISKFFPSDSILTEESGYLKKTADRLWVIDPLDGTTNFINGARSYSSLIAFIENGDIMLGVSYLPVSKELLFAEKNNGAFLGSKKLRVSKISELKKSAIIIDPGYIQEGGEKISSLYQLLKSKVGNIGMLNGNGYTLSLMSQGEFAGFIHLSSKIWECAGLFIYQEAGGKITDFNGKKIQFDFSNEKSFEFVAANPKIHQGLLNLLK